jgi:hypothetical protein
VLEVPEEVAASASAADSGSAGLGPLAAESVAAELAELAQIDNELLLSRVPSSGMDVGLKEDDPEWSSAAQAWSLAVGPYEDEEAGELADEAAASSGLKPLKRKGRGAGAKAAKALAQQAAREARVAALTASGRLLEVLLPRDERDTMFGSQLSEAQRAKALHCGGLPHIVRAVTALARGDAAGAHGWNHARGVQQWLSKPEQRMLLCVSIQATTGLRPAVVTLEGVFQEFAGHAPPL